MTQLLKNRWLWTIALVTMTGACAELDDAQGPDEPVPTGADPNGAPAAQHLRDFDGLDPEDVLAAVDRLAVGDAALMLTGADAVKFQEAQAQAGTAGLIGPRCTSYTLAGPPLIRRTMLSSCIYLDQWISLNLDSNQPLSQQYDLASLALIDTDAHVASLPWILPVPALNHWSMVWDVSPGRQLGVNYQASASVRPRGAGSFLWPLLSPIQFW